MGLRTFASNMRHLFADSFRYEIGTGGALRVVDGEIQSPTKTLEAPDAFAAIRIVTGMQAGLPIRCYQNSDDPDNRKEFRDERTRIIANPPGLWGRQLYYGRIYRTLIGDGQDVHYILRDNGNRLLGFRPVFDLHRWRIRLSLDENNFITGEYRNAQGQRVDPSDLLHFIYDIDKEGKIISPVDCAAKTVAFYAATRNKARSIFRTTPWAFLKNDKNEPNDQEAWDKQVAAFREAMRQAIAGNVAAVPMPFGMDAQYNNVTAEQLELVDVMRFAGMQILKFLTIAPSIAGEQQANTFRLMEGGLLHAAKVALPPLGNVVEQELQRKLLDDGETVEFQTQALLKGDPIADAQRAALLAGRPLTTGNEGRRELGMEASSDSTMREIAATSSMGGANAVPQQTPPDEQPRS